MRKIQFQNGEYYHVYNRGVDRRDIFMDKNDYIRFLTGMKEFNQKNPIGSLRNLKHLQTLGVCNKTDPEGLVKFITYCLNQNHYHFLIKQIANNEISNFIGKLANGYTKYFNTKYNRSGSLFQGPFQAIHVNSTDYLLQLSCYINGNPEIHKITKADNYQWSSYQDYLGKRNGILCDKEEILNMVKNEAEYKNSVDEIIRDSAERKKEIKKLFMEEKI